MSHKIIVPKKSVKTRKQAIVKLIAKKTIPPTLLGTGDKDRNYAIQGTSVSRDSLSDEFQSALAMAVISRIALSDTETKMDWMDIIGSIVATHLPNTSTKCKEILKKYMADHMQHVIQDLLGNKTSGLSSCVKEYGLERTIKQEASNMVLNIQWVLEDDHAGKEIGDYEPYPGRGWIKPGEKTTLVIQSDTVP